METTSTSIGGKQKAYLHVWPVYKRVKSENSLRTHCGLHTARGLINPRSTFQGIMSSSSVCCAPSRQPTCRTAMYQSIEKKSEVGCNVTASDRSTQPLFYLPVLLAIPGVKTLLYFLGVVIRIENRVQHFPLCIRGIKCNAICRGL